MSLIFLAGQKLTASHMSALANANPGTFTPPSGITTTSATYVNVTGATGSLTKIFAVTRLQVIFTATWQTSAVDTGADFGLRINGTDYTVGHLVINAASQHEQLASVAVIAGGIPAGNYTPQVRWRRTVGAGTLTLAPDDRVTWTIQEIHE